MAEKKTKKLAEVEALSTKFSQMSVGQNYKEVNLAQLRSNYVKSLEELKRAEVTLNQAKSSASALAERKLVRDKEYCRVAIFSFTKGLKIHF